MKKGAACTHLEVSLCHYLLDMFFLIHCCKRAFGPCHFYSLCIILILTGEISGCRHENLVEIRDMADKEKKICPSVYLNEMKKSIQYISISYFLEKEKDDPAFNRFCSIMLKWWICNMWFPSYTIWFHNIQNSGMIWPRLYLNRTYNRIEVWHIYIFFSFFSPIILLATLFLELSFHKIYYNFF